MSALGVLIDGEPLEAEEAIAFWKRFSAWMDEHRGDLAGFARSEGLASVAPEVHDGAPVLVASRSAPQQPYEVARKKRTRHPAPAARGPARAARASRAARPKKKG
jgi:hypothetical protein